MYKSRYRKASKKKNRSGFWHSLVLFFKIFLPLGFVLAVVMFLRADFLQIKHVEINGTQDIPKEVILSIAQKHLADSYLFVLPKTNFLLFRKEFLVQEIAGLPRVENVEIEKNWDGIMKINLTERPKDFAWCGGDNKCYLMDSGGLIFAEAKSEEILGKIVWQGGVEGEPIWKSFPYIESYLKGVEALQNVGFQVFEVQAELPDKAVFKTDIGDIYLNPQEDMSLAVPNVFLLVQEIRGQNNEAQFEYIDARFGPKLFYKVVGEH